MHGFAGTDGLPDPERDRHFYAGVPARRAVAWVADEILVGFIWLALLFVLTLPTLGLVWLASAFLWVATDFIYRWLTISAGSATFGMRLFGIELRDLSGDRIGSSTALVHTLVTMLSFAVFPAQLVSAILMVASARGQGLADRLAGTAMINRPV